MDSENARLNERIDALEMRLAYQDQTIEELNAALTDLWKQIEDSNRQLARLGAQVKDIEQNTTFSGEPEPPPPHY